MSGRASVVARRTSIQDEGEQIAMDSNFILNLADQDGDGLVSLEEASAMVRVIYI